MGQRLDRLVTQESFSAEQKRVDGRFAEHAQDITDITAAWKEAVAAEATARALADAAEATARKTVTEDLQKRATVTGLWVRWGVGLIIGIPGALGAIYGIVNAIGRG
ncbi:hypothetical protein [Plantibacter sp. YIM 135249]|uniref:hypothetical protein n=1 Tax=Plantibacter sp. YIM 135249 TaxID=3423918 RepID=UPI003D3342DB